MYIIVRFKDDAEQYGVDEKFDNFILNISSGVSSIGKPDFEHIWVRKCGLNAQFHFIPEGDSTLEEKQGLKR